MIAYTHLMEFIPDKVSEVSGILFFIDDFVQVFSPLVLMYVTNNTNFFLWLGLGMNLVGLLGFLVLYIPESTKYLLEKNRFDDANKDMIYILKYNKASEV